MEGREIMEGSERDKRYSIQTMTQLTYSIVEKLSSVKIMSAASLQTSVPACPIASPMSALLTATASFVPSPVMATILPTDWSAYTKWENRDSNRRLLGNNTVGTSLVSKVTRSVKGHTKL